MGAILRLAVPYTGMILTALAWARDPRPSRMGAATLLLGLGLAHHMTTVLLIPGWLRLMVGSTTTRRSKRNLKFRNKICPIKRGS